MSSNELADEAVAAGAAWLDLEVANWVDLVNLAYLNMSNPEDCVYGQVFGLVAAFSHFDPQDSTIWDQEHGFNCGLDFGYEELEEAWTELIQARRSATR